MDSISAEQCGLCATSRVFTNSIQHVCEDGEVAEELLTPELAHPIQPNLLLTCPSVMQGPERA